MIDFHTHILPQMDDGSSSVEESMEMLRMAGQQGVTKLVCTPHFYAERDAADAFFSRRETAWMTLQGRMLQEGQAMPRLYLGAEVCYFSGIGTADMVQRLRVQGTELLLLEMPFCQWDAKIYEDVERLTAKKGITVMIAHIERYDSFQKNREYWDRVFELPVIPQMNAGPFLRGWVQKRRFFKLAEAHDIVLGSDCHNLTTRPPNLGKGRDALAGKFGEAFLQSVDDRGERMLP